MQVQKFKEFFPGGLMICKTIWILKNSSPNHKAVDVGISLMEFEGGGAVFNVAVDD